MSRPPIFISHSAKEPAARAALEELAQRLGDAGFEVLLDRQRLEVGDPWRATLRKWLDVCRAAVVLVSPSAVDSPNVLNEVAILMQRARRTGRFVVAPVLVAGASRAPLREAPWKATELAEVEMLAWGEGDVAAAVVEKLAHLGKEIDPVDELLELRVAQQMEGLLPGVIRRAGDCLGLGLAEWELEGEGSVALAQRLLESRPADQLSAALVLRAIDRDRATSVYGDVEPYGLVRADLARAIRDRAAAPEHERGLGVNSASAATCELLVRRANFEWKLRQVPRAWTDDAIEEVMVDVVDTVARVLRYADEDMPVDVATLNEVLAEEPVFLLLPDPLPAAPVVAAIEARLGNLVLMFRCGTGADVARLPVPVVEYLQPELPEGEDARLAATRKDAVRRLS